MQPAQADVEALQAQREPFGSDLRLGCAAARPSITRVIGVNKLEFGRND